MKRFLIILVSVLVGWALFAQEPGPGRGQPPRPRYDASKEVSLQGTVSAVNVSTQGPGPFVSLSFLSDSKTYEVMVGPQAVLTSQQITFTQGDALTIVGVASTGPRGTLFMARTITKDGTLVTLLNQDGTPVGRP